MAKTPSEKLTFRHKFGYACGDAGGVITLILISSYMTRYITNVLGISYEILSIMLLVWNIWDTVNDPLMGIVMDKFFAKSKNKKNKFRPWILYSIPLIVLGLIAFFSVPGMFNGMLSIVSLFLLKVVRLLISKQHQKVSLMSMKKCWNSLLLLSQGLIKFFNCTKLV